MPRHKHPTGEFYGVRSLNKREQASAKIANNSNKTASASGGNKRKNKLMNPQKPQKLRLKLCVCGRLVRYSNWVNRANGHSEKSKQSIINFVQYAVTQYLKNVYRTLPKSILRDGK